MYFISMMLRLTSKAPSVLSFQDNEFIHKAIFKRISEVDQRLARELHDRNSRKCMTISLIYSESSKHKVRITLIGPEGLEIAGMLSEALNKKPKLYLRDQAFSVLKIDLNSSCWSGIATWSDFLAESRGKSILFHFATPTSIVKKDKFNRRYSSLFPDPIDIFTGLERRWYSFSGPTLPQTISKNLSDGDCQVSFHQINTVEYETSEQTQIGFVGNVIYTVRDNNINLLKTLIALSYFCFYCGIGYQTTRGMGVVRTEILP